MFTQLQNEKPFSMSNIVGLLVIYLKYFEIFIKYILQICTPAILVLIGLPEVF